jgi:hypothetical protein
MDWPGRIDTAREVELETRRAEDAPVHRTIIWAVVADGEVYVRSLRGEDGRWFRELTSHPEAVLHVEGDTFRVRGVRAADQESVRRASDGFRRKYGDSRSLASMIRDEIAPTTVRLERRH